MLQVRTITKKKTIDKSLSIKLDKELKKIEKKISPRFKKDKKISGKSSIFGQMPDWNPVEMIGKNPNDLAFSLYSELITKKFGQKQEKLWDIKI